MTLASGVAAAPNATGLAFGTQAAPDPWWAKKNGALGRRFFLPLRCGRQWLAPAALSCAGAPTSTVPLPPMWRAKNSSILLYSSTRFSSL